MTFHDENRQLCFLPAVELAERIRHRDLSPVEVVEIYLRRIEERNPIVNAYTLVCGDEAMDAARKAENAVMNGRQIGPLHGVPIAIKDLDDVAGIPTSMGSLAVRDRVPTRSATAVARLLAAGAIILGKTNTPEFGHKGITDNLRFGPTSTPFRIGYNSGGSSGGSAASVADGLAALAQGTDGGGSVRIPASFCGVVGFKPSFGRIPSVTRPDGFLWGHPLVHIGPMSRTVLDSALMTSIMAGPHSRDPFCLPDDGVNYIRGATSIPQTPRIAYSPQLGNFPVDAQVASIVSASVLKLRGHGYHVDEREVDFNADHGDLAALWVRTIAIHYAAIARYWECEGIDFLGEYNSKLTPQFRQMLTDYNALTAVDHSLDDTLRTRVLDGLEDVFDDYDFVVAPTLAISSIKNGSDGNTIGPTSINGVAVDPLIGWCMTYPINFTGHPAISVPAGLTKDGSPIGLQIIGRRHSDESVLAMAAAFERIQPWVQDYPGLLGE